MPIKATAELDRAAVNDFFTALERNSKETGRSMRSSLAWGGRKFAQSLGADTPRGKKKRRVIRNPNPKAKTDRRMADYGVMAHYQTRPPKFVPIYRTGEFGKIRFENKKTATWFTVDRTTGRVERLLPTGTGEFDIPGIMQSKKRDIRRRGFAKKSWQFLQQRMGRGGSIFIEGVANVGRVTWLTTPNNIRITIVNKVKYMTKILKGGEMAVNDALTRATDGMVHQLDNKIRKKMDAK